MISTYSQEDCLRKATEFRAKAAAATDFNLKRSFELLAREFEDRARKIRQPAAVGGVFHHIALPPS